MIKCTLLNVNCQLTQALTNSFKRMSLVNYSNQKSERERERQRDRERERSRCRERERIKVRESIFYICIKLILVKLQIH